MGNWDQLKTVLAAQNVGVPVPVVVERAGRDVRSM